MGRPPYLIPRVASLCATSSSPQTVGWQRKRNIISPIFIYFPFKFHFFVYPFHPSLLFGAYFYSRVILWLDFEVNSFMLSELTVDSAEGTLVVLFKRKSLLLLSFRSSQYKLMLLLSHPFWSVWWVLFLNVRADVTSSAIRASMNLHLIAEKRIIYQSNDQTNNRYIHLSIKSSVWRLI